jgi:hypothetical protein
VRLWAELQVRFHVPVPAWCDLHADLQVRGLTACVSPWPFDERPGWISEPRIELV